MSYPADRRYTDQHEWVLVDGDIAKIGITHHAQDALGEIVHVEFPVVGKPVIKGGSAAEVESVKAVSDVYSPVSGTVTEVNTALDGNEATINSDPHGAGWLFAVKMSNPSELEGLMDAERYAAFEGG
jgi:glycine cleavage system H protein